MKGALFGFGAVLSVFLPGYAHAACLDHPTPSCLVELAFEQVDAMRGSGTFDVHGNEYLATLASIQVGIGDLSGAVETASKIDPQGIEDGVPSLLDFVQRNRDSLLAANVDLTPLRLSAEAILDVIKTQKAWKKTISREADVASILAQIGYADAARTVLNDAVRTFAELVESGRKYTLPAADDLVDAALVANDFDTARRVIDVISKDGMDVEGVSPDFPGWTNESARGALGGALAEAGRLADALEIANELSEGPRSAILDAIKITRIAKGDDITDILADIRALPNGNTFFPPSRDPVVAMLVATLLERRLPDAALIIVNEMLDAAWRDNEKIGIARVYIELGNITAAEALMKEITDSGRARIALELARRRARDGRAAEATQLLKEALTSVGAESNPARVVDWNISVALVRLELDDRTGALAAVEEAVAKLGSIGDPMIQFDEAVMLAAVQLKLALDEDAVATITTVAQGRDSDLLYGRILAANALTDLGEKERAQAFIAATLRAPRPSLDAITLARLYGEAALALVPAAQ